MDSEDKKLLEETLKAARENNRLLRKIRSSMKWGRIFRVIYWLIIVGSMIGVLYYLQPFLDSFIDAYQGFISTLERTRGAIDSFPGSASSTLDR